MTDEERYRVDDALRTEYRAAVAELSRNRHEGRRLGEYLQTLGRELVQAPEQAVVDGIGTTYRLDAVRDLVADIVRLNDLIGQLKDDMRDRGVTA